MHGEIMHNAGKGPISTGGNWHTHTHATTTTVRTQLRARTAHTARKANSHTHRGKSGTPQAGAHAVLAYGVGLFDSDIGID